MIARPDLATALLLLRLSRGFSQRELAEAAGSAPSAICEYEKGKKMPELRTLYALLDALGVKLSAVEEVVAFVRRVRGEDACYAC